MLPEDWLMDIMPLTPVKARLTMLSILVTPVSITVLLLTTMPRSAEDKANIELPPIDFLHGGFFSSEGDIQSIFAENLPAATYLIEWLIQDYEEKPSFNHNNKLPSEIIKK